MASAARTMLVLTMIATASAAEAQELSGPLAAPDSWAVAPAKPARHAHRAKAAAKRASLTASARLPPRSPPPRPTIASGARRAIRSPSA